MIHLVYGEDEFRVQLKVKELTQGKNFDTLENPSLNQISAKLQEAANLLFQKSSNRILVKNTDVFASKQEDKELEFFLKVLKEVANDKEIVIHANAFKGTLKIAKELKNLPTAKIEQIKAFKSWDQKFCAEWLDDAIKNHTDLQLGRRDIIDYVDYMGCEDTAKLFTELERIGITHKKINIQIIKEYCTAKYDIFEFIKYLAKNDTVKAIQELEKIKSDGNQENNLGFLSLIQTNLDLYKTVLLLIQERFTDEQIAGVINAKTGRVYHLKKDTSSMDTTHLNKLSEKLLEFETRIKTGSMKFLDALSLLVHV